MTLDEKATMAEGITGGTAYLVVVVPGGSVQVDRYHPDGGSSGIAYGADLPEAAALTDALERFRKGSSYPGPW